MSVNSRGGKICLAPEYKEYKKLGCLDKRTILEKSLGIMLIASFIMLSILATTLIMVSNAYQKGMGKEVKKEGNLLFRTTRQISENPVPNVCLTPECVIEASSILRSIDTSVDPCDDFYRFSCGNWIATHEIPADKSSVSVISKLRDKLDLKLKNIVEKDVAPNDPDFVVMLKHMYDSCMDLEAIEDFGTKPLRTALRSVGGWPVIEGDSWNAEEFDWLDTLIKFRELGYSHNFLMTTAVTVDFKKNTDHIIYLDQTTLGMPDRAYFLRGLNDTVALAYFNLISKSAKHLGANEEISRKELHQVFEFETALAKISLPREERRNISKLYNKYTVQELQTKVPQINWIKYFNGLMTERITEDEELIVAVPNFVVKFGELIGNTDKRIIANYMMWRLVGQSLSMMPKKWRDMQFQYYSVLSGIHKEPPRWGRCLFAAKNNLGIALGAFYVRNFFKEDSKVVAVEMVQYIHSVFLQILNNVDWMEEETRTRAKEKAESIEAHVGYPPELMDDTKINELYKNLTLVEKQYFGNTLKVNKWATDYVFSYLRLPNVKNDWTSNAHAAVVNAFYSPLENSIKFPAGILQSPLFNKDRPYYLNFGAIGCFMGHEITHGFDDTGRQFDKEGNVVNWWDKTTDRRYREKVQCIIHQYGNYTVPEIDMKINGINMQGENTADNGAVKEAYKAYKSWVKANKEESSLPGLNFSPEQLFWISYGSMWCGKYRPEDLKLRVITGIHSPPQFRVIGPLSNTREFAEVFQCPVGSPMNPEKKCEVW